ncbi:tetratricopeptide repeat protein [Aureivirga sp. CE67]|uniref:tetratricopeptide repeat protein n=1 Tax=Aureivirga sp. CE67 TaxID=1788983 RepID=UPI001E3E6C53|nr:tetratricopeptide repeat protein [Aureivirga sp. CE67]
MLKTNEIYFFDSQEFEEIVHYYLDAGKKMLAKKAIQMALEQHPASIPLRLLWAETLIFEEQFDKANAILKEIYAIEPKNEEIYILKANLLSNQFKHERAIEYLHIGLEYSNDPADIFSLLGIEYLHLDKFDQAREFFIKCLDEDLEDYPSLYNVIYCFDMQGKHKEAVEFLKDFIEKEPYSEIAWHQLGRQYFTLKEYKQALRAFDYAVIIDEFFVGGYIEKAKTLEKLEQYDVAINNYLIAVELDQPNAFTFYRIGECYIQIDKLEEAYQYFKKSVKQDPLSDKGWFKLALLASHKEDFQTALFYINKVLQLDEVSTQYWRKYAEINLRLNFYEESITAFQKCIDLRDNTEEIWLGYADVLLFIGEYDQALEILLKSQKYLKDNSGVSIRLCGVYFLAGNKIVAKSYLKEALELNSEESKILEIVFPTVYENAEIKEYIEKINS